MQCSGPVLRNAHTLHFHNSLPPGDYKWFPDCFNDSCAWADVELEEFIYFEYNPSMRESACWTVDTLEAFRVAGQARGNTWVPSRSGAAPEHGPWLCSECSSKSLYARSTVFRCRVLAQQPVR